MSLELEREHVVQQLCAHYAQDHLSTGELEARFDRAYKSRDMLALKTVLDGLPAIGPLVAPPKPLHEVARPTSTHVPAAPEKRYVAFFGDVKKQGHWLPNPRIRAKTIFGSITLDLREAEIPMEGIDIDAEVILGSITILLPPGLGADVDCSVTMGSVTDKTHAGAPGAPRVRVTGNAILGSLEVETKLPKKARMEAWRLQLKDWFGES